MAYLKRSFGTITERTSTSPILTTPALGTPSAGVVTNLSGVIPVGVTGGSGLTLAGTVGEVAGFAVAAAPTGWIICNGAQVSRTVTYDALFGVIGTTWGAGNGSSTFHLPDLRGVFLRGVGTHGSISYSAGGGITTGQSAKSGSLAVTGAGGGSGTNATMYTGSGTRTITSGYYSSSDINYSNMTFAFNGTDSYPSNITVNNCIKY
jgi:microcystin-dependent protein